jgi:cholesterol transport system auxiliary component
MKYFVVCLFLVVTGCSVFPEQKPSAVHDFGQPYSSPLSEIKKHSNQPQISVAAPKWLVDNRFRYRLLYSDPTQVRYYTLDRWIAPPSELFEQLLNSSEINWHLPIMIHLNVFEQQFISSTASKVVMHFTVATVQDQSTQQSIEQNFQLEIPCPSPDAKGAVVSFNLLVRKAADKIQAWLNELN